MRIAALIFAIAGAAYLAWDVALTLRLGVSPGTWFMVLFAWAMLYQSYAMFRARKGARWTALISAAVFSLSSMYLAILVAEPPLPEGLASIPVGHRPMLVALVVIAVAFGLAVLLLAFVKPPRADPKVGPDVPQGRPRSDAGPPAT